MTTVYKIILILQMRKWAQRQAQGLNLGLNPQSADLLSFHFHCITIQDKSTSVCNLAKILDREE